MNWLEYHEEPVMLHSGSKSHWLVRADLIFADVALRTAVLDCWQRALCRWTPPFEIVSVPRGGDIWADVLRTLMPIVPTKDLPTMPHRVIVDDVVTTGNSISDSKAHIRLAVVDRRDHIFDPYVNSWARIHLPLCDHAEHL